jgi:flagellar biosynthesis repressor protein FlbT
MALIIDLKPGEKILIGSSVMTNDNQRTRLHISGDTPILREKDIMQESEATSPCRKIYFLLQCMYLARNPRDYHAKYFSLMKMIQDAAPSTSIFCMKINAQLIQSQYYKSLREARELIAHEDELIQNATMLKN